MNSVKISSGASGFDTFQNKKYLQGTREFLSSNSIIAKLGFLILVVFVFIILLRVGSTILNSIFSYSSDPVLLNGTMKADQLVVVNATEENLTTITTASILDGLTEAYYPGMQINETLINMKILDSWKNE